MYTYRVSWLIDKESEGDHILAAKEAAINVLTQIFQQVIWCLRICCDRLGRCSGHD